VQKQPSGAKAQTRFQTLNGSAEAEPFQIPSRSRIFQQPVKPPLISNDLRPWLEATPFKAKAAAELFSSL